MITTSILRRAWAAIAGASAVALLAAGPASAHHCLVNFNEAAQAQVAEGTAWMPLGDFIEFAVVNFGGASPACAAHADEWAAEIMEIEGLESEPNVHMKATVGGGAAHRAGREPVPFNYMDVEGDLFPLIAAEPDCA
ncbi:hypothetical protein DDE18_08090 [Nocardioides gansuensis]|uniref:Uncharacterized protein n=1 Tax=Nocardioides gansuensis TaxID=2138300 RepID=A0A2T8FC11_9ACTN|nr:hypothetical protein [Nocardioides gansuensis]PVG83249.1 hypothetical protein DDE18_08090 [Nocardioides gansuensis]